MAPIADEAEFHGVVSEAAHLGRPPVLLFSNPATPVENTQSVMVIDPPKVKSKGRPKRSTRFKSGVEISMSSQPKKKRCKLCQGLGHYMTTCSLGRVNQTQLKGGPSNLHDEDENGPSNSSVLSTLHL